jgi:hypothetical protein
MFPRFSVSQHHTANLYQKPQEEPIRVQALPQQDQNLADSPSLRRQAPVPGVGFDEHRGENVPQAFWRVHAILKGDVQKGRYNVDCVGFVDERAGLQRYINVGCLSTALFFLSFSFLIPFFFCFIFIAGVFVFLWAAILYEFATMTEGCV